MFFPLLTQRLSFSPLQLSDLDAFIGYRQDPEVARFQSWDPSYSTAQGADLIQSQHGVDFPSPDEWLQIGIRLRANSELVGDLALHAMPEPGEFEIGFSVATEHQGQGYAFEAAKALLDKLFQERGAVLVVAFTDSRNTSSKALLRKLGFIEDPTRSWIEEFKGETVEVLFFELVRPAPQEFASSHPAGQ